MRTKPQPQLKEEPSISKKESLDTLLKHVAEGKKQIARGEYYTSEEARALTDLYATMIKRSK